uniref:hypothetical protein n=1 Tax=Pelomonas sp. KK5 TaxID=1855730 RepID=UPI001E3558EC
SLTRSSSRRLTARLNATVRSQSMRVASRHMQKFTRRPLGLAGWLFIACFLAAIAYLAATRPQTFLVVLCGFAVLLWIAHSQSQRDAQKLVELACQREGQTICEFARDFDARAIDTWIIRAVYDQLQERLQHVHPSFPIRANDRLKEDLMLDDDDLDMDLAPEVEVLTGRSMVNSERNPYFGKVKTVRDFVLFFQNQPGSSMRPNPQFQPTPNGAAEHYR